MNGIFFLLAAVLLLPACCTTLGAASALLVRRAQEQRTRRMLCGMAAGIMLAASVWSLLLPAIERSEQGALSAWLPLTVGLVIGAVGLLRLEQTAWKLLDNSGGRCGRMVLAVTLHNLPEGMVVGLAAALALQGEPDAMSGALALALRTAEHPGGRGGQLAAFAERREAFPRLWGGAGIRAGGAAWGAAGAGLGGLGPCGAAVAHERRRRVHGLRHGAGDDPRSRRGR